jgi:hypothetical protein
MNARASPFDGGRPCLVGRIVTTPQRSEVTPCFAAYGLAVFFWAVVSDEINRVIRFFPTRWQAERMLAKVLWARPDWSGVLHVEKIEFRTGNGN